MILALEQDMACRNWKGVRTVMLAAVMAGAGAALAKPDPGNLRVDFAAAVPSGSIYTGTTVDLIATLKVTSPSGLTRRQLVNQAGFNPRVSWLAREGTFTGTAFMNPQGDSTVGPNGIVFVSRGTYRTPAVPGTYTVEALPEWDPSRRITLTINVEDPPLRIHPSAASLGANQRLQFRATLPRGICLWQATGGEISEDGLYRAPLAAGTYQVMARSALDPNVSATASVTVNMPSLIMIVPEEPTLRVGQSQQFTALGLPDGLAASWSVSPPSAGTITEGGLFTAGQQAGACSVMFFSEEMGATISVNIVSARLSPDPAFVRPGGTLQFTAQGLPEGAPITWSLQPASAGTITGDGQMTAGPQPVSCRVSAAAAGVEISIPVQILAARITPEHALTAPGGTIPFTFERFGPLNTFVTWKLLGEQPGATLGQDGLYQAPSRQGVYRISASDSLGNTTLATVTVGPPSGLLISPEILIEQEGVYTVWVWLKASNGNMIESNFTGEFRRGKAHPEIVFPIRRLQHQLGVDGPYSIERISVHGTSGDEAIVFDTRENLGATDFLALSEAAQEWIRIGETPQVQASTAAGSGLIDQLVVTIPVELTADGTYRISAKLLAEDGTTIDSFTGQQEWARGTNTARMCFDGRRIRAAGASGPMSISEFTVEGPVSRERSFPRAILGYDFRMFTP